MRILVAGEGLIDFLPIKECREGMAFLAKPGGSPLNVAVGLSRLGVKTGFLGKLSFDPFGELLFSYLSENGVDLTFLARGNEPTALSFVHLESGGEPRFSFYGCGTADASLTWEEVPDKLPESIKAFHLGSLAMVREPCATALAQLLEREYRTRLISFDPNIRPEQMSNQREYQKKFSRWLPMIDLLKLSQLDLNYISPNAPEQEVVQNWLSQGPKAIIVTLGRGGARGYTRSASVEVKAQPVKVVDSVGAGDAFTAGFLAALYYLGRLDKRGIENLDNQTLERALRFAIRAAALTCTRIGADPPRLSELGEP